jgi:hypothetical protein
VSRTFVADQIQEKGDDRRKRKDHSHLNGGVNMTGMRGQHEQEWGVNMVRNLQKLPTGDLVPKTTVIVNFSPDYHTWLG